MPIADRTVKQHLWHAIDCQVCHSRELHMETLVDKAARHPSARLSAGLNGRERG